MAAQGHVFIVQYYWSTDFEQNILSLISYNPMVVIGVGCGVTLFIMIMNVIILIIAVKIRINQKRTKGE